MAELFKANDVVTAAIEIEKRGEKFYLSLVDQAEDSKIRKVYEHLAREEVKHKQLFEELAQRLSKVELPAWSNESEYLSYLNALIDSHPLFRMKDLDEINKGVLSRKDALHIAIQFEKESILFFMEMREFVPESEKTFVTQCIDEERDHLRRLSEML
ncbi:ferritin-like domain-containing protein [Desulforhopalus singaporensis]|uniref:Rubrerythrin n=1 Tax=Desulforhopalus singaporensis TaxID=91360 RepID=A0A1H0SQE0_9BACT|nr:ferritin family protein [Desulforhopalus singaporensis]SDP43977.1 Rubrerythrin [Desulforhopalus singaporensis]